uniref:Uncharacterized protein n=1 Tax=Pseudonaja textilis TaxID=8673 RepID=A0A670YXI9_PSETE
SPRWFMHPFPHPRSRRGHQLMSCGSQCRDESADDLHPGRLSGWAPLDGKDDSDTKQFHIY